MRRGRILPFSVMNLRRISGFFQSIASREISIRRRGIVRFARRNAERRAGVFGCMRELAWGLLGFPMERTPAQGGVVLELFQTVRRVWALFVARGDVARDRFAFCACLGAL